jgi:UDP-N-acetylmuramoyl-L-alanyl-D-glutamate--2,6-diaminopimelate ligase
VSRDPAATVSNRTEVHGRAESVGLRAIVARVAARELIGADRPVHVRRAVFDHRRVEPPEPGGAGDLFCCLPGELSDGHRFAAAAAERGAVALLVERPIERSPGGLPQVVVGQGRGRHAMAEAACLLEGDPASELVTLGVTGTNGKTTTTYLLRSILQSHGWPTIVVGTLGGPRTTPESPELQAAFRRAVDSGTRAVALEVTSHGLVQHRVDGYRHDVAVFTNLSQDHLDYHGTMEAYFEAKALLFRAEHARNGVVNADDPYGRRLLRRSSEIPLHPFSLTDVSELEVGVSESRFRIGGEPVRLRLAGELNVRNAVAAAAAARAAGIDDAAIARGLSLAGQVPGRFETVPNALSLTVMVDFAHTPAGLGEALRVTRQMAGGGRVIVVFGAGGDRDHDKRPLMGEAASSLADVVVLTSDNPRHEDPVAIIESIRRGCSGPAELAVEPDRRRAIEAALRAAAPGDVVLVAGKGHETTQQIGDDFLPFDDRQVVAECAATLAGTA